MAIEYLKTAPGLPAESTADTADIVQVMLARISAGGEDIIRDYARRLDGWACN